MQSKSRNPLEPVATVVSFLLAATSVLLVISAIATVFGSGSVMGIGHSFVYVDVPDIVSSSDLRTGQWILRVGTSANTIGYRLGVAHPDVGQRVWYTLTMLPGSALFIGALILLNRLIRGAKRDGIYTPATAKRLRTLGWFLLAGALTRMIVEAVAANRLLATMVANQVDWLRPNTWDTPWAVLLIAAGLLSFARVMRIGAEMRDDLQGTV
ncbi:DUF2975 domain-containing protein [Micromonospora sp. NPDC048999]|uniref:DUF2975 domain-containing protein n=1 Tax=Micromonospora sp. NPDC048999 TaxID=3155391 RepID=UPI00340861F3